MSTPQTQINIRRPKDPLAAKNVQMDVYFTDSKSMGPVNLVGVNLPFGKLLEFLDQLESMEVTATSGHDAVDKELTVSNGHSSYTFHTDDLPSKDVCKEIVSEVARLSQEGLKPQV